MAFFRSLTESLLRYLARKILQKYRPDVIGITGTVGKTSTREAISAVLAAKFSVRQSIRSYNDALGVPLTIIGKESPGRSIAGWVEVVIEALRLLMNKDTGYPEMLIVEMGADRPGDIRYLVDFCPPKVAVLTAVSPTHFTFFKTMERLESEKRTIFSHMRPEGLAVLNADDERVIKTREQLTGRVATYGTSDQAMFRGSDIHVQYNGEQRPDGMVFKMQHDGALVPVALRKVLGRQHMYAALAAAAVGTYFGMNMIEIAHALTQYVGAPGRMRIVDGIKRTTIIDDTYNSSPRAAHAAVETLAGIMLPSGAQRYAVLGDMLELGSITTDEHEQLGKLVGEKKIDFLITVGEAAKHIARGALAGGMEEHRIAKFNDTATAGVFLQEKIQPGDVILVKGSQGMRMEKIVKEIMAEPLTAGIALVRQYGKWLN